MAANSQAGATISQVAKEEGDNSKGSTAAQMQSNLTRERNAANATSTIASKMTTDPSSISPSDARTLQSKTTKAQGGAQPEPGSLASQAASLASANEAGTTASGGQEDTVPLTSAEQSQLDREANFEKQAAQVKGKLDADPAGLSKQEADAMHSREQRAFGGTEKGGLASQAQSQVAENEGVKK
ncbi:MAG: hypothetical protein OHK93_002260 [Ramalina farinacea]|uniref:SMP domain-containing protein n=1 Tax=Ramalina farinacea TaxID=258253 RepID=A0AA43TYJ8_9LECA|nr:hypothetical protein [Ramalina farinacea]